MTVKDQKIRVKKNKHGIPVLDLPKVADVPVKFGFLEKPLWQFAKKKRVIGGGMSAIGFGIAQMGMPWGWIVLGVGVLIEGVGIGHWLGKKSAYGKEGSFSWENLLKFLVDMISKVTKKGQ